MRPGAEITVFEILRQAFAVLVTDTPASDAAWFGLLRLHPEALRDKVKAAVRRAKPTIKLGWATTQERWPVVSVVLAASDPVQQVLGQFSAYEEEEDGSLREVLSMVTGPSIRVMCHGEGLMAAYLNTCCKGLMLGAMQSLVDLGYDSCEYGGDREFSREEAYLPENIWTIFSMWRLTEVSEVHGAVDGTMRPLIYVARDDSDRGDGELGGVICVTLSELGS